MCCQTLEALGGARLDLQAALAAIRLQGRAVGREPLYKETASEGLTRAES